MRKSYAAQQAEAMEAGGAYLAAVPVGSPRAPQAVNKAKEILTTVKVCRSYKVIELCSYALHP